MLTEVENTMLARRCVSSGLFGKLLGAWTIEGTRRRKTEETRKQVEKDVARKELAMSVVTTAIKLASSNGDCKVWGEVDWDKNIATDRNFKDELENCLDCVADFLDAGTDTQTACSLVISCVDKQTDGTFNFSSGLMSLRITETRQTKANEVQIEVGKAEVEKMRSNMKEVLRAMKKLIQDYEHSSAG
jgi:hypothetical protein